MAVEGAVGAPDFLGYSIPKAFRSLLVNVGDPPALPGRPSVFDVSGSNVEETPRVSR